MGSPDRGYSYLSTFLPRTRIARALSPVADKVGYGILRTVLGGRFGVPAGSLRCADEVFVRGVPKHTSVRVSRASHADTACIMSLFMQQFMCLREYYRSS